LVELDEDAVDGVLIVGITPADMLTLDRFEGDYYVRRQVIVSAQDGNSYAAEAYVFRDEIRSLLSDSAWDVDQFRETDIKAFLAGYVGFEAE
jgi:hypothetical protein